MNKKGVRRAQPTAGATNTGYQPDGSVTCPARAVPVRVRAVLASLTARRASKTIALAVGVVLTGAIGVQPAHAGTYVMRNCNVPGHGYSASHPWQQTGNRVPNVALVDACATGGGWGVTIGGSREMGGGYSAGINIQKPTGSRSQIKFVKLVLWYAARLAGSGQPLHFYSGDVRSDGVFHPGLYNVPPGSENLMAEQQLSPETKGVQIGIKCGPDGVVSPEPCVPAHDVPLLIRGMEVTLSEDVPPLVLPLAGTLIAAGPQGGIRTLTFSASDAQSGLLKIDVFLGETLVASHDLTPRCSYSDFTVCPASDDGTLQIDTRAVANGAHRLAVRVLDAAGNERMVYGDSAVQVVNEPSLAPLTKVPTPTPTYALSAHFKGSSRATLTVPYARRVSVTGRLTQGSQPIDAGTVIELLERRDRRGAREVRRARVKTKADGSFSAVVTTRRPSRRIRLAFRPAGGSRIVSRTLKLRVRAASRVRASLRGSVVRFSGRVLSGPIPKAGKRVLMEGRAPGSAWTAFKSLRTDRKGRFSGAYRLRVRRPGVTLKIRAVVRSEGGYGYLSSRSRAVTLRVR